MRAPLWTILSLATVLSLATATAGGLAGAEPVTLLGNALAFDLEGATVPCPAETAEHLGGTLSDFACIQVAADPATVERHLTLRFEPHGIWIQPWSYGPGNQVVSRPYMARTGHGFVFYLGVRDTGTTALFIRQVTFGDAVTDAY